LNFCFFLRKFAEVQLFLNLCVVSFDAQFYFFMSIGLKIIFWVSVRISRFTLLTCFEFFINEVTTRLHKIAFNPVFRIFSL
jgi:DNA integrity scanning protein DisA with diadenylate cyclase activity